MPKSRVNITCEGEKVIELDKQKSCSCKIEPLLGSEPRLLVCEVGHSVASNSTVLGDGNYMYSPCKIYSSLDLISPIIESDLVSGSLALGCEVSQFGETNFTVLGKEVTMSCKTGPMLLVLVSQIVNPDLVLGSRLPVGKVSQTSMPPSTVLGCGVLDHNSDLVSESISPVCEIHQSGVALPTVLGYSAPVYKLCMDEYAYFASLRDQEFDIAVHEAVVASGLPNYMGCRIPLRTNIKVEFFREHLADYYDIRLVKLLQFGFPIGDLGLIPDNTLCKNHKGALAYPSMIEKYIIKELQEGSVMGPFHNNPFSSKTVYSTLTTVEKTDSVDRRIVMDLSFPTGKSVKDMINYSKYLTA